MVMSIWTGGRTASKTYCYVPYALNLASHVLDYFGPQFVCSLAFAYILCWFFFYIFRSFAGLVRKALNEAFSLVAGGEVGWIFGTALDYEFQIP